MKFSMKVSDLIILSADSDDESGLKRMTTSIPSQQSVDAQSAAYVERQDAASVDRQSASSVDRQSASSVDKHNTSSVERENGASVDHYTLIDNHSRLLDDRTPSSIQRSDNLGRVSSSQHSVTHHDTNEVLHREQIYHLKGNGPKAIPFN